MSKDKNGEVIKYENGRYYLIKFFNNTERAYLSRFNGNSFELFPGEECPNDEIQSAERVDEINGYSFEFFPGDEHQIF